MIKKFCLFILFLVFGVFIFVACKAGSNDDSSSKTVVALEKAPNDFSVLLSIDGQNETQLGVEAVSDYMEIKFSKFGSYLKKGVFDNEYAMVEVPYFQATDEELSNLYKIVQDNMVQSIKTNVEDDFKNYSRKGSYLLVNFNNKEFDIYNVGESFVEKSNEAQYQAVVEAVIEMAQAREEGKVDFMIKVDDSARLVSLKIDDVYVSDFWTEMYPLLVKLDGGHHKLDIHWDDSANWMDPNMKQLDKVYEFDLEEGSGVTISLKDGELVVTP